MQQTSKFKVAVVREEGSNGDREMAAAVHAAGEVWGANFKQLHSFLPCLWEVDKKLRSFMALKTEAICFWESS